MTLSRRHATAVVALQLAGVLACADAKLPTAATESELRAALTVEAQSQLDAEGRFVLALQAPGEISESDAKQLAIAWWRSTVGFVRPVAERDRGAKIHADDLQPCPRAYYAVSAYEPTAEHIDPLIQKMTASRWLVGLCYGGTQEVLVAVSALAGDARTHEGRISAPGLHNFFFFGVPVGGRIPVAPEDAAVTASMRTGTLVAAAPRLLLRSRPFSAANAVWDVSLANDVLLRTAQGSASRRATSVLVGHFQGWRQPAVGLRRDTRGPNDGRETVRLAPLRRVNRPGIPGDSVS